MIDRWPAALIALGLLLTLAWIGLLIWYTASLAKGLI